MRRRAPERSFTEPEETRSDTAELGCWSAETLDSSPCGAFFFPMQTENSESFNGIKIVILISSRHALDWLMVKYSKSGAPLRWRPDTAAQNRCR